MNTQPTMSKLVIVESPAKCQKIQGFLGAGWRVMASMGHIRALQPSLEAIGLDRNFEAKYEWIKEKSKTMTQLKDAAKSATQIYLAADDDREGEAIAYAVCLLLKQNPATALRAVFHEITEKAVTHAVQHPRTLDMNRVHAQQARAILDMMIGFTISPLLWKYVAPALSAGRCQTPALRILIEREDAIQSFKASSSWQLHTRFHTPSLSFDATMTDELDDEESAMNYMENVYTSANATITKKDIKPWTESAPPPLMTSTLQQQASALYGMNPKNTMKVAQQLYEAGHITYMRTDKAVLSEEARNDAVKWVQDNYGENYVVEPSKKSAKAPQLSVNAQEAHEAIRPTHMEVVTIQGDAFEQKIYRLIWQRAIQSVMAPAKGETCHITSQLEGDTDFSWLSKWKRTTFEGWKRVGAIAHLEDESMPEEESSEWDKAVSLETGTVVSWNPMRAEPKESKAKGRFTEATLVRELETHGIGRPSTFASLLSVIQEKDYAEIRDIPAREVLITEYSLQPSVWPPSKSTTKKKVGAEKKKMVPTDLGRSVWNWLKTPFHDLFAYEFTAQMEQRLDQIANPTDQRHAERWKQTIQEYWDSYRSTYESLKSTNSEQIKDRTNPKIRTFANGLKAVQTKKGPMLLMEGATKDDTQFYGWPKSAPGFDQITEEEAIQFQKEQIQNRSGSTLGEWKGETIQKRSGKFGDYLEAGSIRIPFQEGESQEEMIARFEAKKEGGSGVIKTFKEYLIRTGPYGPYIMKPALKKPQFVSLPKGLDPQVLTEAEVDKLYRTGLEEKKRHKNFTKGPKAPTNQAS